VAALRTVKPFRNRFITKSLHSTSRKTTSYATGHNGSEARNRALRHPQKPLFVIAENAEFRGIRDARAAKTGHIERGRIRENSFSVAVAGPARERSLTVPEARVSVGAAQRR
jgi:hypothetical protein